MCEMVYDVAISQTAILGALPYAVHCSTIYGVRATLPCCHDSNIMAMSAHVHAFCVHVHVGMHADHGTCSTECGTELVL